MTASTEDVNEPYDEWVVPRRVSGSTSVRLVPALIIFGLLAEIAGGVLLVYGLSAPSVPRSISDPGRGFETIMGILLSLGGGVAFLTGLYGFLTALMSYMTNRVQTRYEGKH